MAIEECVKQLKKDYTDLTEQELDKISDEIDALQSQYGSDKAVMQKAVKEYIENSNADLRYNSLTFIRNKVKEQRLLGSIVNSTESFAESFQKMRATYLGDNSIDSSQRTRLEKYHGQMLGKLKEGKVETEFFSGKYDFEIRKHAFEVGKGGKGSADPKVVKMYEALKAVNDSIYSDWHLAGLNIRYRKDFLTSVRYDIKKLAIAEPDDFADMAMRTLDKEATFSASALQSEDEMRKILKEMYEDMVNSKTQFVVQDDISKTYLRKLKSRKLEFSTAEGQAEFMSAFGVDESLSEGMMKQMDISAKQIEVTNKLGTNFDKTFNNIASSMKKSAMKELKGKSPEEASKFLKNVDKQLSRMHRVHKQLTSPPYVPSTILDQGVAFLKNVNTFTKLGVSLFSNLYDLNSSALQYTLATGESQAIGMMKSIKNVFDVGFDKAKRQELAELLNIHAKFIDHSLAMGGTAGDLTTGFKRFDKLFSKAYDATFVPFLTEVNKLNNAINMSYAFEKMARLGYDSLDNLLKANADRYKFNQLDFDYVNKFLVSKKKHGVISPTEILAVPLEEVKLHYGLDSDVKAARVRDSLYSRYANFIDDSVMKGSPMATTAEKLELGRLSEDPLFRTVSAIVTQFKETPYRIAKNNIEAYKRLNQAYGGARAGGEVMMYATMGMTSFAAFESLRRMILGQPTLLEDLRSGKKDSIRSFTMNYLNRSAIMPILTDVADAVTSPNRTANLTSYAAGPTLGMVDDASNIVKSLSSSTEGSTTKAFKRFTGRHVLPNNFLIKAGLRHGFDIDLTTLQKIRK